MRHLLLLPFALIVASSHAQTTAPNILVVQRIVAPDDTGDPNILVRAFFSKEFAEDGRLSPVSYSLTDTVIRTAIEGKKIAGLFDSPTNDQMFEAAKALDCEYVFVVQALKNQSTIYANGYLFKGRKEIWKYQNQTTSQVASGFDLENAVASLARTWVILMASGPLKDLKKVGAVRVPDPETTLTPTQPQITDVPPPMKVNNETLKVEVDKLVRQNEAIKAIQACRMAIDAEPLDPERRLLLIDVLKAFRQYGEAASEAHRSAELFPEVLSLRMVSAECLIAVGKLEEALNDLTENLVRNPDDIQNRMLLAELCLYLGRPEHAKEHLEVAGKGRQGLEFFVLLGSTEALLGHAEDSNAALESASKLWSDVSVLKANALKDHVIRQLLYAEDLIVPTLRDAITNVRRDPKSIDGKKLLTQAKTRIQSLTTWLSGTEFMAIDPQSKQRALVGLRLLEQCQVEIEEHVSDPSQGLADEATLTLGNAARAIAQAKAEYFKF